MRDADAFEHEFNELARWTADAIAAGPPADAIPGACNGSGSPGALAWLCDALGIGPTTRVIDTGAGLGGPAAWLRERTGTEPFVAEPMAEAARGARRLFCLPSVVAWSHRLPLATASFDAAMALAVLSTVRDKDGYLREVHRILRPGGRLGVLDYVLVGDAPEVPPVNNDLIRPAQLDEVLSRAGFEVVDSSMAGRLQDSPAGWDEAAGRVRRRLEAVHAGDPILVEAGEQEDRFGRLLADGTLRLRAVHAVAR